MEELDDAAIDAQVEKELDEISLSSIDLTLDINGEDKQESDLCDISEPVFTGSSHDSATLLYLEKSSERSKVAQDILSQAEDVLSRCSTARKRPESDNEVERREHNANEFIPYELSLFAREFEGKQLASAKSAEEIEKENDIKLSELEERLKADAERDGAVFERDKKADQEAMTVWIEKEEKVQKSMKTMMEKADYWEKTYVQVAQDELAQRENELQEEFLKSQKRMLEMEEEEKRILSDLLKEKEKLDKNRKENAAKCIQTHFRGYAARKTHGSEVRERIFKMKERRREKRIEAIEKERAEERKAKEERDREKKKKEMEAKKQKKILSHPKVENSSDQKVLESEHKKLVKQSTESVFTETPTMLSELKIQNSSSVTFATTSHVSDMHPYDGDVESSAAGATGSKRSLSAENREKDKKTSNEMLPAIATTEKSSLPLTPSKQNIIDAGLSKSSNVLLDNPEITTLDLNAVPSPGDAREHAASVQENNVTDLKVAVPSDELTTQSVNEAHSMQEKQNVESTVMEQKHCSSNGNHTFTKVSEEAENLRTQDEDYKSFSKEERAENLPETSLSTGEVVSVAPSKNVSSLEDTQHENLDEMISSSANAEEDRPEEIHQTTVNKDETLPPMSSGNLASMNDAVHEDPDGNSKVGEFSFRTAEKSHKKPLSTSFNEVDVSQSASSENIMSTRDSALENHAEMDNISSTTQKKDAKISDALPLSLQSTIILPDPEEGLEKASDTSGGGRSQAEEVELPSKCIHNTENLTEGVLGCHGELEDTSKTKLEGLNIQTGLDKNPEKGDETDKGFGCAISMQEVDESGKSCSGDMRAEKMSRKLLEPIGSSSESHVSDQINADKKLPDVDEHLTRTKIRGQCLTESDINDDNESHEKFLLPNDVLVKSESLSNINKNGVNDDNASSGIERPTISRSSINSEFVDASEAVTTKSTVKHSKDVPLESEKILDYTKIIEKQRQGWLERRRTETPKQSNKGKSPPTQKRRRMIRVSSAAKRLDSFSEEELLNAAHSTPECRVGKKASSVEESKCIVLSQIQGGRNLSSLANCAYLTYLTVRDCGLVSLENLQSCPCLKYIDAAHNAINMISCGGMRSLECLDLSHNRLSSIHGLEGCQSLLFLDLSSNSIAKIATLEDAASLSHLRLADNQLINISGLRCCDNLVYLDVSENHLVSLEDLEACKMLLAVAASGNNLESLSRDFLDDALLLTKLDVSRNNLSSLGLSELSWLPSLTELRAEINRISSIDDAPSSTPNLSVVAPFLSTLDLSKNLVSTLEGLKSLSACRCLQKADLSENPLSQPSDGESSFLRCVPEIITERTTSPEPAGTLSDYLSKFSPLDHFGRRFADLTEQEANSNGVVTIISKQLSELQAEVKRHSTEIQRAGMRWEGLQDGSDGTQKSELCPPRMFSIHADHLKRLNEMMICFRKWHEKDLFVPDIHRSRDLETDDSAEATLNKAGGREHKVLIPRSPSEILAGTSIKQSQHADSGSTRTKTNNLPKTVSGRPAPVALSSNIVRSSAVYEKLNLTRKAGILESVAAKKIQACWRGYCVRKRLQCIAKGRVSASIRIQAMWRGYRTRRKIAKAMEMLNADQMETPRHEEFEGVDLEGFDFDETSFDQQWAYKVDSLDNVLSESTHAVAQFENYSSSGHDRMVAHKNADSEAMSLSSSKPPLPPIPSREQTPIDTRLKADLTDLQSQDSSVTDSNRTKKSTKQEILSSQWGIKSSSTADLMMRRARRMKGGRKKMQTAGEKLLKFQEKVSNYQTSDLHSAPKRHHPVGKVEYFKAREQEYAQKSKIPAEEDEQKMKYTYEWLHTQTGAHYDPHFKTSPLRKPSPPATRRTRSSGFLPAIPSSPSLVGVQDLEVTSVVSSGSYLDGSKERLRDIARRHNPRSDFRA